MIEKSGGTLHHLTDLPIEKINYTFTYEKRTN